ncbi:hypothetical protein AVEN_176405-1 [Araneus ventricosus]|uniref:Uncharacterized protein n=1 Tax=Araneus ventricosus TaxID=182803 RepID=A0A4Y2CA08_ARAVE|nr:hypothetical protein AVEN_176405-1 [Araneus ventricosus]
MKNSLCVYRDVAKVLDSMDENFSLSALSSVLIAMTAEFRVGYILAFSKDISHASYFSFLLTGIHFLSIQLLIMFPGSIVNEKAKYVSHCLLYRIPNNEEYLKCEFKKDLKQEKCLTLWKIYALSRSLIIASLGTLVTYGILIGTLGKEP